MANRTAAPIVVPPSEEWDGNDGPWSTFNIHVGNPAQPAKVLISTALGETWVISANKTQGGCLVTDTASCPQLRGTLFNVNKSTSWQDQGIFALGLELNLEGYTGNYDNGDYGLDTLGVGLPGTGTSLPNIVVAALATKDYYLGYLGVTSHPTNFTAFDNPHASFLSQLKSTGKIASLSYAYTAGAQYRFKKVDGSLTLGGYDASKFEPNDVDFQFASDISRDLVVGIQSISYTDSKHTDAPLLNEGILSFIDSTVPTIWLPQDSCTLFEEAFGLTYNNTINRYIVNDTVHNQLTAQNASITFTIGNDVSGGASVNITFPYAAFDLDLGSPIVNSSQKYFPLRRAANDTQYTLGRTFLQEAYLITNYESSNFSVSQNKWVQNSTPQLQTISPASNNTHSPLTKVPQSHKLSIGAIVGIIVAAVVGILLAAGLTWFCIARRRRRRRELEEEERKKNEVDLFGGKPEMDATSKGPLQELFAPDKVGEEMDGSSSQAELAGKEGFYAHDKNAAEMQGSRGGFEMEGTKGGVEMEASKPTGGQLRSEMAGDHLAPVEMYAGPHGLYELPSPNTESSDVPSPLSPPRDRRSRVVSWARRTKIKPSKTHEHSESSDISAPDTSSPERRSDAPMWSGRRPPRTSSRISDSHNVSSPTSESGPDTNPFQSTTGGRRAPRGTPYRASPDISSPTSSSGDNNPFLARRNNTTNDNNNNNGNNNNNNNNNNRDVASRYAADPTSPVSISSPTSESSRDQQRRRGDRLTEQLERQIRTNTRTPRVDSQATENTEDRWNRSFGATMPSIRGGRGSEMSVESPSESGGERERGRDRDGRRREESGTRTEGASPGGFF